MGSPVFMNPPIYCRSVSNKLWIGPGCAGGGSVPSEPRRTRIARRVGAALAMLLCCGHAVAAEPVPVSDLIEELGLYAERLEDPGGELSLDEVRSPQRVWTAHTAKTLSAGFNTSAWWLRVAVRNDSARPLSYFLDTGSSVADYVDVYLLRGDEPATSVRSGDRRIFSSRPLNTRTVVVPVHLAPGESVWIYTRLGNWDGLHEIISLSLVSEQAFAGRLQVEALALGIYYGTLVAILLYNLFLFLFIRDRVFGLYVFYVAAFLSWSFILRGYALQYLWPDSPHFNNQALPLAAGLCYLSFGLFALDYLDIRKKAPAWLYRAYWIGIVLNVLTPLPAFFGHYAATFASTVPSGILMVLIAVVSGVLMIGRGSRPAKYFLLAFSFLAFGVVLYYMQLTGLIRTGLLPEYGIQIGSALEVLLLAFGLADQMNTLKSDKLKAEQQARKAQADLTTQLAVEVKQRTAELERANRRLNELATVDELTGALNRRRFNQLFETEFIGRQAEFALCMIDLDGFKHYNDACGHQAGDRVLQTISSCLSAQLGEDRGTLFRLGGEEFAVLFGPSLRLDEIPAIVESMRAAVEALAIEHPRNSSGVVTASFGLLMLGASAPPHSSREIYARTDELLYQAKAAGRNCVVQLRL